MSGLIPFTPRETQVVSLLADGLTVRGVEEKLGTKVSLADARAKTGVTSVRALVYVSIADGRIPRPAPVTAEQQPCEVTELIWAGLRFDVHDKQLPGALAPLARASVSHVKAVLDDLTARHQTTYCGLIARGYALGLLSGREGTLAPTRTASAAAPARVARPGPARTGTWGLTGRQGQALALLPLTGTADEAAAQMAVSTGAYRKHLKTISALVGVGSARALVHRALQDGILRPPPLTQHHRPEPDVATVWRGLVLDVPDHDLDVEITAATGLSGGTVRRALAELRADGEADWQLVARGWASGIITPQDGTGRLTLPEAALRLPRRADTAQGAHGSHRPATPRDRLHLLPGTTYHPSPRRGTAAPLPQGLPIGQEFDLVRVVPDVCRQVLAGLPPARWGPVVGRVEARTALLLTAPAVLPDGWRARHGRLWSRGGTVMLPPDDQPAPDGAYWAVSRHAPLWDPARLEDLLNHLPPALAATQHG
ncbi:hypothetical protein [Streptomyces globisporus]|uniref:hypothetical protein n=1 Tax=Streptomyces globisporus TaxID=1908 RepID=UPI0036A575DC